MRAIRRQLNRLGRHPRVTAPVERGLLAWLDRCNATAEWTAEGEDDFAAAVREGPVILLCWHGRLALGVHGWQAGWGPVASLNSSAQAGQLMARVMARRGWQTTTFRADASNRANSMQVLRLFRDGVSLTMAPDGPLGPARQSSRAPLDWARATGAPVWLFSASTARHRLLSSWDRMMMPLPRSRAHRVYRPWGQSVPRRATEEDIEALRRNLEDALNAATEDADRAVGLPAIVG